MKVIQHLWFEKNMKEAIEFYVKLIPNSKLDSIVPLLADNPSGPSGSVTMASFTLGDQRYMAIEAGPLEKFNHSFSIMVEVDNQAELDRIYDALAQGGKTEDCGWVIDRFGLTWQVAPKMLQDAMRSPDRELAKRVAEAQLKMKKFDIAKLEAAAQKKAA